MNKSLPSASLLLSLGMIAPSHAAPPVRSSRALHVHKSSDPVEACIREAMQKGVAEIGRLHCSVDKPGKGRTAGVFLADANGAYVKGVSIVYGAETFIVQKMDCGHWLDAENGRPAASIDMPVQWLGPLAHSALAITHRP